MAKAGEVTVDIVADTTKFKAALRQVNFLLTKHDMHRRWIRMLPYERLVLWTVTITLILRDAF